MTRRIYLLFSAALFFLIPLMNAQNKWFAGVQSGIKLSFSTSVWSYNSSDINGGDEFSDQTLASQYGIRIGRHLGSNLRVESGITVSGHAHNFKSAWGDKDLLGDKLSHRLIYYALEIPLLFEYKFFETGKYSVGGFLGAKMNFSAFRPYWDEASPWSVNESVPFIQTAFFLPNSETGERRYVISYGGGPPPSQTTIFSVSGGVSAYYNLNDNWQFRVSPSYTYGTDVISQEELDVKTMYRDEFGVLVQKGPEVAYGSASFTTNLALDFAFLYQF